MIADARIALEKRDVTPVLKWVKVEHESEIRALFTKTLKVRTQGPEAREVAETYFFETLVRIHRAGEGAPYTGLKPVGAVEPIIRETDQALESGTADKLTTMLQHDVAEGIRERFARVLEAKKHAGDSAAEGRAYVQAYVELTHHVEALDAAARGRATHRDVAASEHAH